MLFTSLIQGLFLRFGYTGIYKNRPLDDAVIDKLIEKNQVRKMLNHVSVNELKPSEVSMLVKRDTESILLEYIKIHKLKPYQVTNILKGEYESNLVQEILRTYELNEEQEEILAAKNNILLLENYLSPKGYLDPEKRLSPKVEKIYIINMLKRQNNIGLELFKTYVDNNKKTILTDEILKEALERDCIASRYLLLKSYLTEEQEEYLLLNASQERIEDYIAKKQLYSEKAQILLVEKYFSLAKLHHEDHGLRPKVQQLYRSKKREEIQALHPEANVP
jgi:hypothetical protein